MNWNISAANSRSIRQIVIRKSAIAFSSIFIKDNNLTDFKFVTIYENEESRRIGFAFSNDETAYSLKLKCDGGGKNVKKGNSRIAHVNLTSQIPWLGQIDLKGKSFIPRCSDKSGFFYIEIAAAYSGIKPIAELNSYCGSSGVYRLYDEYLHIIRIGESSDIQKRIQSHLQNYTDIQFFDVYVIREREERKKEEQRLFVDYRQKHNSTLPRLNAIAA